MARSKLNDPAFKREFIRLWNTHRQIKRIALDLGVTPETAKHYSKKCGLTPRPSRFRPVEWEVATHLHLYQTRAQQAAMKRRSYERGQTLGIYLRDLILRDTGVS